MSRSYDEINTELGLLSARMAGAMAAWKDDERIPFSIRTTCQEFWDRDSELRAERATALAIESAQTIAKYSV